MIGIMSEQSLNPETRKPDFDLPSQGNLKNMQRRTLVPLLQNLGLNELDLVRERDTGRNS